MTESEQKGLLQGLLLCFAVAAMPDLILSSFFPDYAYNTHGYSETSIGILYSAYQIMFLASCSWIGNNMAKIGRRQIVWYSIVFMALASFIFALSSLASNRKYD